MLLLPVECAKCNDSEKAGPYVIRVSRSFDSYPLSSFNSHPLS